MNETASIPPAHWPHRHGSEALAALDQAFLQHLDRHDPSTRGWIEDYRQGAGQGAPDEAVATSEKLLTTARALEVFLAEQLGLAEPLARLRQRLVAEEAVVRFRDEFVERRARKPRPAPQDDLATLSTWLWQEAGIPPHAGPQERETAVARFAMQLLEQGEARAAAIERLTDWCVLARQEPQGQDLVRHWASFRLPKKLDHQSLVAVEPAQDGLPGQLSGPRETMRRRDGFDLTDPRPGLREVQQQVGYCVYCHGHNGDYCAKGFPGRKQGLRFKVDPLGVALTGCPLEERISEMNLLRKEGMPLAALAMAMADNPMIPATGHRICNDCMKACIYQKQDPVDVPAIETRVLTDVLALPHGVELYDLLCRYNPLRATEYRELPWNGRKVLVVGLGPAGFALAHHLTMRGFAVFGIDGLKIEPLPKAMLAGPVADWAACQEPLGRRIVHGFGGVAEYGITPRWDKNFLKLIQLTLSRRKTFAAAGGVRFGGTLTLEDAWDLGFDHVALATGAGLPRVLDMPGSLAKGMRQASDFLMALQLTGAARDDSLAHLQVRLPAVVIGGGLTAVDAATELQAHYIHQVERAARRHAALEESGWDGALNAEDRAILEEWLAHAQMLAAERRRAAAAGEAPHFIPLLRAWGGVTIVYRRRMAQSPAYTRNHQELAKALEEGILYMEGLEPVAAVLDEHGWIKGLCARYATPQVDGELTREITVPARTVLVAAGTVPNTIYEREHPGHLALESDHFRLHDAQGEPRPASSQTTCKDLQQTGFFTSNPQVSVLGDAHAIFQGSVVKAIASGKQAACQIAAVLPPRQGHGDEAAELEHFMAMLEDQCTATVAERIEADQGPTTLWIRAPLAARHYRAGQFFRLQTDQQGAQVQGELCLQIPLLAVSGTGSREDRLRLLVYPGGSMSPLVNRLTVGQQIVLMGPNGMPAQHRLQALPAGGRVLLLAAQWGTPAILDLASELSAQGHQAVVLAQVYNAAEMAPFAQWDLAGGRLLCWLKTPTAQIGGVEVVTAPDLEQALGAVLGRCGHVPFDAMLVIGGGTLLVELRQALAGGLPVLSDPAALWATMAPPMQCMMQGVCAQCLVWVQEGSVRRAVFACAEQDQPLQAIDLETLRARQNQNRLLDALDAAYLRAVLSRPD
jgi:NADPH-dependent glutamate synthase beta subunit-like oxidoreductase/ferredoxin-NADP reductase